MIASLVLASPDVAGPADLMGAIAARIQAGGIATRVVNLDRHENDDAAHARRLRAALTGVGGPVILGGFSLGARIVAAIAAGLGAAPTPELAPLALLCFGYPFHRAGHPRARHGLETLAGVQIPTRIIQGTRDPHGNQADVQGYKLPDSVELVWLRDGNHRFVPRARSGLEHDLHLQAAAAAAIAFVRER